MIKHVLFDLDGTLTDPREGIVNSIVYAIDKMGLEAQSPESLKSFIGPPLLHSFKERFALDDATASKAVDSFREYFTDRGIFENTPFPHIGEVLQRLHEKGLRFYVATAKPTVFAKKILVHFKLDHYFINVVGSHLDNTRTDKGEIIAHVLQTHGIAPATALMVGDTPYDLQGAANNGLQSIGVTYGYGDATTLAGYAPVTLVNDCLALEQTILKML